MSSKKSRRRRKNRFGQSPNFNAPAAVTINPGEVPTDEQLEAEMVALDAETDGKYEVAKQDDLDLSALQHMSNDELLKLAKKEKLETEDYASLPKQKLVFEILKARAMKQGLMVGEGTLDLQP